MKEGKVSDSGDIADKARLVTDSDKKISALFFALLEKPSKYVKFIKNMLNERS